MNGVPASSRSPSNPADPNEKPPTIGGFFHDAAMRDSSPIGTLDLPESL